jgi:pyrimidine-nucleoside phosphorylase
MVRLAGLASSLDEARMQVGSALSSGRGLERFRQMVEQQGGDPRIIEDPTRLPAAPHRATITADRSGYVAELDAELIGHATCVLGAGREHAHHSVDHAVGAIMQARVGEAVKAGELLAELHYRDEAKLNKAMAMFRRACVISDEPPTKSALILEVVE